MDEFVLKSFNLGVIEKLQIGHDNKGGGAGWFLDHIEVEDTQNEEK